MAMRKVQSGLRGQRLIGVRLTGGTFSLDEGTGVVTGSKTGTGDYLITFAQPFVRTPVVVASTLTASTRIEVGTVSTTSVQIKSFGYNNTTATDANIHAVIVGWDVSI